jgi:hypothetical protein
LPGVSHWLISAIASAIPSASTQLLNRDINGGSANWTVGGLTELPSYFLRVHRSHLVNTKMIDRLQLAEGAVPVSRRIKPGVRRALK